MALDAAVSHHTALEAHGCAQSLFDESEARGVHGAAILAGAAPGAAGPGQRGRTVDRGHRPRGPRGSGHQRGGRSGERRHGRGMAIVGGGSGNRPREPDSLRLLDNRRFLPRWPQGGTRPGRVAFLKPMSPRLSFSEWRGPLLEARGRLSGAFTKLGGDLSTRKLAQGDMELEREQAAPHAVTLVALRAPESHQAARADPTPATRPFRPRGPSIPMARAAIRAHWCDRLASSLKVTRGWSGGTPRPLV
jgi:hypothetical protein